MSNTLVLRSFGPDRYSSTRFRSSRSSATWSRTHCRTRRDSDAREPTIGGRSPQCRTVRHTSKWDDARGETDMKPVAFDYERPATLMDAARLLGRNSGFAKIMAGGQSLGPMLNL